MKTADFSNFTNLDIRVGTIKTAEWFEGAHNPAYKLEIDFGKEIGTLKSSAQITALYSPDDLLQKQVVAIVNFPKKQIATFMSECLVLGVYNEKGVVLLQPDKSCNNGEKLG